MQEVYHAELSTEPAEVNAGEAAALTFTIRDAKGQIVRGLAVVHERPMHLLVISEDLSEFYHLHPEQRPDGSFRVAHTFPYGGGYLLYVDYAPPGAGQVVSRLSLRCDGEPRPPAPLAEDEGATKTVDALRVTMKPGKPLRAGEEVMLDFAVADAETNEPVIDLEPYLGALAHFVIVSQDGADFLHAHPVQRMGAAAAHARGARG